MPISGLPFLSNLLRLKFPEQMLPGLPFNELSSRPSTYDELNSVSPLRKLNEGDARMQLGQQQMYEGIGYDEIQSRIGQARRNLGAGTLTGLLSTLLQSSKVDAPKRDDTYLDRMVRKTPQYILDSQNAEVDRTTNSAISNVLSNNPINRSANAVNAIVASGVEGKNRVIEQQAQTDIGLENQYLGAKQNSLDRYNAGVAQSDNLTRDNENTKIGNAGALGTNYFNQIQDSVNNMNMLKDQREVMKSSNYMQMQYLDMLRRKLKNVG